MSDQRALWPSPVGFVAAVAAVGIGTAVGLAVVPVAGSYVGMLAGGFLAGLGLEQRPLVESGLAAGLSSLGLLAAAGMVGSGVGAAVSALGAVPPAQLLTSVLLGGAVGAFGAHFGDDLRDGLTTPVESPSTTPGEVPATGRERTGMEASTQAETEETDRSDLVEDTSREEDGTAEQNVELERE